MEQQHSNPNSVPKKVFARLRAFKSNPKHKFQVMAIPCDSETKFIIENFCPYKQTSQDPEQCFFNCDDLNVVAAGEGLYEVEFRPNAKNGVTYINPTIVRRVDVPPQPEPEPEPEMESNTNVLTDYVSESESESESEQEAPDPAAELPAVEPEEEPQPTNPYLTLLNDIVGGFIEQAQHLEKQAQVMKALLAQLQKTSLKGE